MADAGTDRGAGPNAIGARAQQPVRVQRAVRHLDPACAGFTAPAPFRAGPVGVDLDAVALGVGEVHRFAHQVVRRAVETYARRGAVDKPAAEIGA